MSEIAPMNDDQIGGAVTWTVPPVATARLHLRRFEPDDFDLLDRLNRDPAVMQHMGGPMSPDASAIMLRERILDYYQAHPGLGIWATLASDSGRCIGMHALNHMHGESHIQIGYRLFPEFWGQGYATEMSRVLIRYGFECLRLPTIVGITDPGNLGSQRVLLKCGLHPGGLRWFAHPAYAAYGPQLWYECDRDAWLAKHG